ncbi:hypothetical protein ACFVWR_15770 [Leifsonia sp. NPDC058292]|uniref:hypothetical protein n=1 Tax=Leifsonia sp. NPDC058292 TaxID=3346428 RepID=UPI0036DAFFA7
MKRNRSTLRVALAASAAVLTALAAAGALAGCAASGSVSASTPAPTVTVTATATPAPVKVPASPDDPIDALTAWHACAVLGLANYAADHPGSELRPYDPANGATKNPDGTYQAIAGFSLPQPVDGTGSIVAICTIGGTLGAPKLVSWTLKDI